MLRIDPTTSYALVPPTAAPAVTEAQEDVYTCPPETSGSAGGSGSKGVLSIPKGTPHFVAAPQEVTTPPVPEQEEVELSSAAKGKAKAKDMGKREDKGKDKEASSSPEDDRKAKEREAVVARMKAIKEEEERRKRDRQMKVLDLEGDPLGRGRKAIAHARGAFLFPPS